jgi:hypothetical protein
MSKENKRDPYSGKLLPEVESAAGFSMDRPAGRAWIRARYGLRKYHPLAVGFAEAFAYWDTVDKTKQREQIELEERNPREGACTMLAAEMWGGVLRLRARFESACGAAALAGDVEFFRTFHEVQAGLSRGEFPVGIDCLVLRAWQWFEFDGVVPTKRQIFEHISADAESAAKLRGKGDPLKLIEAALRKLNLPWSQGRPGPIR